MQYRHSLLLCLQGAWCFTIGNYRFETMQIKDNLVKTARVASTKSSAKKKAISVTP